MLPTFLRTLTLLPKSDNEGQGDTSLTLLWFFVGVILLAFSSVALKLGMFFDGVLYATLARNLSVDLGTFWNPIGFDEGLVWREHPTLAFYLQSLIFDLFGDSPYVERIWGFLCVFLVNFLSISIVRGLFSNKTGISWWFLLLFWCNPLIFWIASANMLELTLAVFTTCAVLCGSLIVKEKDKSSKQLFLTVLTAFFTFLAFLTKGPVGIFPLVCPLGLFIVYGRQYLLKTVLLSGLCFGAFVAFLGAMFLIDSYSWTFFKEYFEIQVFASMSGQREVATNRFNVAYAFLKDFGVPLGIIIVFGGIRALFPGNRLKESWLGNHSKEDYKKVIFLLLIAVGASFPFLLFPKQMKWYLYPSYPLYTIVVTILGYEIKNSIESFIFKRKVLQNSVKALASFLMLSSIVVLFLNEGTIKKRKPEYNDLLFLNIKEKTPFFACQRLLVKDWSAVMLLSRFYQSSISRYEPYYHYAVNYKDWACPEVKKAGCELLNKEREIQKIEIYRCEIALIPPKVFFLRDILRY